MTTVLLSIKPRFAEEILAGTKRFELRAFPGIPPGARIVLYASSPVKAIVGEFTAGRVLVGSYEDVVKAVTAMPNHGLSDEDFNYIRNRKKTPAAIEVLNPVRYCSSIPLDELRRVGLKNPPRSYMYLKPENRVHRAILELIERARLCA
jgi:predicted transcriptional regulator